MNEKEVKRIIGNALLIERVLDIKRSVEALRNSLHGENIIGGEPCNRMQSALSDILDMLAKPTLVEKELIEKCLARELAWGVAHGYKIEN